MRARSLAGELVVLPQCPDRQGRRRPRQCPARPASADARSAMSRPMRAVSQHDHFIALYLDSRRNAGARRIDRKVRQQRGFIQIFLVAFAEARAPRQRRPRRARTPSSLLESAVSTCLPSASAACARAAVTHGHLTCTKCTSSMLEIRASAMAVFTAFADALDMRAAANLIRRERRTHRRADSERRKGTRLFTGRYPTGRTPNSVGSVRLRSRRKGHKGCA